MRYITLTVVFVFLLSGLGAGCITGGKNSQLTPAVDVPGWDTYQNEEFGFLFQYPEKYNLNKKDSEQRTKYLGEDVRFVLSLSDPTQGEKPENIIFVYFKEGMDIEAFKSVLFDSYVEDVEIVSEDEINQGGIVMTRLENTTSVSTNKVHYLQEREDGLLIFSVFLYELDDFEEILKTLRVVE